MQEFSHSSPSVASHSLRSSEVSGDEFVGFRLLTTAAADTNVRRATILFAYNDQG